MDKRRDGAYQIDSVHIALLFARKATRRQDETATLNDAHDALAQKYLPTEEA